MPHGHGRNTKEVRAVFPLAAVVGSQSDVRLIYESRGLQGVPWLLRAHEAARHTMQLGVNERHQAVESGLAPPSPFRKQLRDFLWRRHTRTITPQIVRKNSAGP